MPRDGEKGAVQAVEVGNWWSDPARRRRWVVGEEARDRKKEIRKIKKEGSRAG